jgi:hypothetical protein
MSHQIFEYHNRTHIISSNSMMNSSNNSMCAKCDVRLQEYSHIIAFSHSTFCRCNTSDSFRRSSLTVAELSASATGSNTSEQSTRYTPNSSTQQNARRHMPVCYDLRLVYYVVMATGIMMLLRRTETRREASVV